MVPANVPTSLRVRRLATASARVDDAVDGPFCYRQIRSDRCDALTGAK